jgi:hypothetical protein
MNYTVLIYMYCLAFWLLKDSCTVNEAVSLMVYSGDWGNLFMKKPEVENLVTLSLLFEGLVVKSDWSFSGVKEIIT